MSRKTKAAEFENETYNVHVTGRNVLVTDAMKQYAIDKVSKIEKFSDRIIDIEVTMDIQKLEHRVDITLKVGHTKIKASAGSEDIYISIDRAVDRVRRQLSRYKTRLQEHHAKGLNVIDMNVNVVRPRAEEEILDVNDEIEEETLRRLEKVFKPHEVVSREVHPLKTLNLEEAVMKMELSGDSFLVYLNEKDQQLKIMYRRKDGNYGIIEPETSGSTRA